MKRMSNAERKEEINRKALMGGAKVREFDGRNADGTTRWREGERKFNVCLSNMKGEEIRVPPPYDVLYDGKWISIKTLEEEEAWYLEHPK